MSLSALESCPLFRGIDASLVEEMLATYPHKTKPYATHEMVAVQDDSCDHLMILTRGRVQTRMTDASGKMIVVEELRESSLLAPAFLFGDTHRMPVTIIAMEPSEVLYFSRPAFTRMLQTFEPVLLNFLNMISNRSRFLSQKLNFHAFKSIRSKIGHYLLEHRQPESNSVLLTSTQQELADYFGVTRPSLARVLSEMSKEGLITIRGKKIEIENENKLRFG